MIDWIARKDDGEERGKPFDVVVIGCVIGNDDGVW